MTGYRVGPFMGVTQDKVVKFPGHHDFRVVTYAAYNACGLVGTEHHGVAVLDETKRSVVTDLLPFSSFATLTTCSFEEFKKKVNGSPRCRELIE